MLDLNAGGGLRSSKEEHYDSGLHVSGIRQRIALATPTGQARTVRRACVIFHDTRGLSYGDEVWI